MLREYEFTLISKTDQGEEATKAFFNKYEEIIRRDGGEILKKDDWGSRKLAYPIKKTYKGQYTHYDFVTTKDNMTEMERLMGIDDQVLRYLAINIGENIDVTERKAALAKESAKQKEEASAPQQH